MLIQNQQGFFGLAQNTFNIIDADIIQIRSKNEYDADKQSHTDLKREILINVSSQEWLYSTKLSKSEALWNTQNSLSPSLFYTK